MHLLSISLTFKEVYIFKEAWKFLSSFSTDMPKKFRLNSLYIPGVKNKLIDYFKIYFQVRCPKSFD